MALERPLGPFYLFSFVVTYKSMNNFGYKSGKYILYIVRFTSENLFDTLLLDDQSCQN